jgi:hypothetical protein
MSRQHISLKSRVRYEGRVKVFDRRAPSDTDLEKPPEPIWRMVNRALRSKFRKVAANRGSGKKPSSIS